MALKQKNYIPNPIIQICVTQKCIIVQDYHLKDRRSPQKDWAFEDTYWFIKHKLTGNIEQATLSYP